MIFQSPYHTLAMSGFPLDKTTTAIQKEITDWTINKNLPMSAGVSDTKSPIYIIKEHGVALERVPTIRHPIAVTVEGQSETVIDCRTFVQQDRTNLTYVVRNSSLLDYRQMVLRGRLQQAWVNGGEIELRNASVAPAILYARWIGSTLTQRLMLEPQEQQTIEILCAYFYYNLFTAHPDKDEQKVFAYMSRHMGYDAKLCMDVVDQLESELKNAEDLCKAIEAITGSVRLKDFDAGILFKILAYTYFGTGGSELCAIAVEHPPTWVSMVYQAYTDSMYKKSSLGRLMERGAIRDKMRQFSQALHHYLESSEA